MRVRGLFRLLALVAVLVVGLTACGGDGNGADDGDGTQTGTGAATDEPTGDDTGAATGDFNLIQDGVLTVCTDSPYEPFEFEEEGEFTGFDVELVRAIAEDIGLTTELNVTPFDAIQSGAALAAGDCDLAASAMTITEEREENLDFSDPYFDADQSLLIREEDAATYQSLEDLAGESIGVQASTTGADYAHENTPEGSEIIEYPDSSAAFAAIQAGEIEAILQDFPVNGFFATQNEGYTVTETFPTDEQYGFAVAEEGHDELLSAINDSLAGLRDSGGYDAVFEEWFGEAPA